MGMNKVLLIGRLIKDVEMRYSASNDTAIARYTLAVNRPFKREGEPEADFLPCVAFNKTAEFAEKYLAKGIRVAIEGRIQTGSYTNGKGKKVYVTEIVVERQEFLEKKTRHSQPEANAAANNSENAFMDIPDGIDEELPFN
jgi:single-strand DNA-binding protein